MTRKAEKQVALTEAEVAARDAARGFTDADLADVMDNPEWTDEQLRDAKPFAEVFPEMAAAIKPARRTSKP